jgi:RNA methyltransferase, TrmH family
MKFITSSENPVFRRLKKLAQSARGRRKTGHALLDGVHLLQAYLDTGSRPVSIAVTEAGLQHAEIAAQLRRLPETGMVVVLPEALFAQLTTLESPSGVLTEIETPQPASAASQVCVLLEDIQDPGNLGSILRSAAASGVDTVYLSPRCADAWSPRVLRAAMGAHFAVTIIEDAHLASVARQVPQPVIATSLQATVSLFELALDGPVTFILGNEGAGVSPELLATASQQAYIPMPGAVESINVAAAAAVCFFERTRQALAVRR